MLKYLRCPACKFETAVESINPQTICCPRCSPGWSTGNLSASDIGPNWEFKDPVTMERVAPPGEPGRDPLDEMPFDWERGGQAPTGDEMRRLVQKLPGCLGFEHCGPTLYRLAFNAPPRYGTWGLLLKTAPERVEWSPPKANEAPYGWVLVQYSQNPTQMTPWDSLINSGAVGRG